MNSHILEYNIDSLTSPAIQIKSDIYKFVSISLQIMMLLL